MRPLLLSLGVVMLLAAAGCKRETVVITVPTTPVPEPVAQTKTLETIKLGETVRTYERESTSENLAEVKKALAELDGEIAELEALVTKRIGAEKEEAAVKLKNLQAYRAGEVARFTAAQAQAPAP